MVAARDVSQVAHDHGRSCYAVHMAHTFGGATPKMVSAQAKLRDPAVDRAMAELKFPRRAHRRDPLFWSATVAVARAQSGCAPTLPPIAAPRMRISSTLSLPQ